MKRLANSIKQDYDLVNFTPYYGDEQDFQLCVIDQATIQNTHILVNMVLKNNWRVATDRLLELWPPPQSGAEQKGFFTNHLHEIVGDVMWAAVLHNQFEAVVMLGRWYTWVKEESMSDMDVTAVHTWAMAAARLGYLEVANQLFKVHPCSTPNGPTSPSAMFPQLCVEAENYVRAILLGRGSSTENHLAGGGGGEAGNVNPTLPPHLAGGQPWRPNLSDDHLKMIINLPEELDLIPEKLQGITVISMPLTIDNGLSDNEYE
ncbi:hypothetical protein IWQ60_002332 [Tieghemiomyces parasiticus]|uniref:Uncharacterized protein n=1 Tax=Tieghemiomyces parasiticus TaxID=78921 RepID=A0A9W8ABG4_9FUNG|nr:hypothetical protein IWQ60_002332 [Tieghemiomyces parasiticus]